MTLKLSLTLVLLFTAVSAQTLYAQLTRSEVNLQFMRAEKFMRLGKEMEAIEALEALAEKVPQYSPIYLREAGIYEQWYNRTQQKEYLSAAVFMYRKYISLEPDVRKISEATSRLNELEDVLRIEHFEDMEEVDKQRELANPEYAPIITSNAEAQQWVQSQEYPASSRPKTEERPIVIHGANISANQQDEPLIDIRTENDYSHLYDIQLPQESSENSTQKSENVLDGHWVSDLRNAEGRESWIFDIAASHSCRYQILMSSQSGIIHPIVEQTTIMKKILNFMKSSRMIGHVEADVVNEEAFTVKRGNEYLFTFTIDEEFVPSINIYNMSRNVAANLAQLLPYSSFVGSSLKRHIDQKEKEDQYRSVLVEYRFTCQQVAPDRMECTVTTSRHMKNENGRQRVRNGETLRFMLYRTPADYDNYTLTPRIESSKSEIFIPYDDYEEALLWQYGVEREQDFDKAVKLMTMMATQEDDSRAKAWLANYYFHEAYNDQTHSSRTRRAYLQSAEYWCQDLQYHNQAIGWGIKGDMVIAVSAQGLKNNEAQISASMLEQVRNYYLKGAEMGDSYSTYRLGHLYWTCTASMRDLQLAQSWLGKAAAAGSAEAKLDLALLALDARNYNQYLSLVNQAAEQGLPEAWLELSNAYMQKDGIFRGVEYDYLQAMKMRRMAERAEQEEWRTLIKRSIQL